MDHSEAVERMAAERYLLDELTPDEREAFEEHLFDCPDCALDLRAGAAFVDEAKVQLPELTADKPALAPTGIPKPAKKQSRWNFWLRPAFAIPAFAALLMVIGYQNLVTFPALRMAAVKPLIAGWVPLHGATRGGTHLPITADRKHGVALPLDLPQAAEPGSYSSYSFDLYDPQGKLVWTGATTPPAEGETASQPLSLVIPGAMLTRGTYAIAISGIASNGQRTVINRYLLDVTLTD